MKEIVLGLIKGRHALPVENYIVEETELKVFTKEKINSIIINGLNKLQINQYKCFHSEYGYWWEYNGDKITKEIPSIKLYITGLTIVTLCAVEILNQWGYDVDIMGYNPTTQEYYSQGIFYKEPFTKFD